MTKKSMLIGAIVIAMIAVIGCGPGADAAPARGTDVNPGRYLALGDSLTFGYSSHLEDPWLPERFVGYPEIIEHDTHMKTTNLGCPGQTAEALISRTALDNGCFDARAEFRQAGVPFLHADYNGTQLAAALAALRSHTPPSLISIQGGGNEWYMCTFDSPYPARCLNALLPKVTFSLRRAVTQLRAAGYHGPVVIVGYHLVRGFESEIRRLNRFIGYSAARPHVAFANAAVPFQQYARLHHGDLCTAGLLVAYSDGSCDELHPSRMGHRLVARAVLAAADQARGS